MVWRNETGSTPVASSAPQGECAYKTMVVGRASNPCSSSSSLDTRSVAGVRSVAALACQARWCEFDPRLLLQRPDPMAFGCLSAKRCSESSILSRVSSSLAVAPRSRLLSARFVVQFHGGRPHCPVHLMAQDTRLSRGQYGFDSRTGRYARPRWWTQRRRYERWLRMFDSSRGHDFSRPADLDSTLRTSTLDGSTPSREACARMEQRLLTGLITPCLTAKRVQFPSRATAATLGESGAS